MRKGKLLWWDTVQCSVFLGCVLGPLLLNIYIKDFPQIISKLSHTILFAMIPVLLSHPLIILK